MERKEICSRMKIGSCAPCVGMDSLVERVLLHGDGIVDSLSFLKVNYCPEGENPKVPQLDIKKMSSSRFRLAGR